MDTLPELTQALIAHTIALEEATKKNQGGGGELKISIESLITSIKEKADVADQAYKVLNRVSWILVVTIVCFVLVTAYFITPAIQTANKPVEIREVATGKVFEVVK